MKLEAGQAVDLRPEVQAAITGTRPGIQLIHTAAMRQPVLSATQTARFIDQP
jgi:hypothetical protein